jgi:hypothetical protein
MRAGLSALAAEAFVAGLPAVFSVIWEFRQKHNILDGFGNTPQLVVFRFDF